MDNLSSYIQTGLVIIAIAISTILGNYFQANVDAPKELAKINTSLNYIQSDLTDMKDELKDYALKSEVNSHFLFVEDRIKKNSDAIEKLMDDVYQDKKR